MTRSSLLLLAASLTGICSIHAQTSPAIADAKSSYNSIKGYLTRAAAAMPEEDYSFKPTPDIRTFAALLAHIADHQVRFWQPGSRSGQADRLCDEDRQGRPGRTRSPRLSKNATPRGIV
ncbi:MAG: hypothetical protein WDO73_18130 [Ignavibacteriota bacterium]